MAQVILADNHGLVRNLFFGESNGFNAAGRQSPESHLRKLVELPTQLPEPPGRAREAHPARPVNYFRKLEIEK